MPDQDTPPEQIGPQPGMVPARHWGSPAGMRIGVIGLSLMFTGISVPVSLSARLVVLAMIIPLVVAAVTAVFCVRYWRSGVTLTADEVIIQNMFSRYRVPLTQVVRASAGAYGVSVFTRDGTMLSASAVQKDRLADMTGRVTRADQIASAITEAAQAAGAPAGDWQPSPAWLSGQALGLAGLGAAMVAGYLLAGRQAGPRGELLGAGGLIVLAGSSAWWLWLRVRR